MNFRGFQAFLSKKVLQSLWFCYIIFVRLRFRGQYKLRGRIRKVRQLCKLKVIFSHAEKD